MGLADEEKSDPYRDVDSSLGRVDARYGLRRLQEAIRHILRVPKERTQNGGHTRAGPKTEDDLSMGP